jgi:hypothetical protein
MQYLSHVARLMVLISISACASSSSLNVEKPKSTSDSGRDETIETYQTKIPIRSRCPDLMWSSNPGAYEMQLQRRCNNPYFPALQQNVSEAELTEAIKIDYEDYSLAEQRLLQIGNEIKELTSDLTMKEFHYFRERLEDIISFSIGAGGRTYELASMCKKLREALILSLRQSISSDNDILALIEEAEYAYKKNNRIFHTPVMAQMVRERSPIDENLSIPTILSEDAQTISLVMSIYDDQTRLLVSREALKLLEKGLDSGYIDPEFNEKLMIFSKEY